MNFHTAHFLKVKFFLGIVHSRFSNWVGKQILTTFLFNFLDWYASPSHDFLDAPFDSVEIPTYSDCIVLHNQNIFIHLNVPLFAPFHDTTHLWEQKEVPVLPGSIQNAFWETVTFDNPLIFWDRYHLVFCSAKSKKL